MSARRTGTANIPMRVTRRSSRRAGSDLLVPEEQGGQGGDIFSYALMCEGLARYGPDFATALMVPMFTAQNIVRHGSREQAAHYIEPFLAGEMRFVISLSEPQAGSDAANARTRAGATGMAGR